MNQIVSSHRSSTTRKNAARRRACSAALLLLAVAPAAPAGTLISWNTGSATWTDGTGAANWSPAQEPTAADFVTIGIANAVVTMGSNNAIASLDMYNGTSLLTNGHDLSISGNTTFNGGVTGITIAAGSTLTSGDVIVGTSSGGQLTLNGGTLLCVDPTASVGELLNLHGTVNGYGTLYFTEAPAAPTTLFENDATLTATSAFGIFIGGQPTGTLLIKSLSSNARIDLDGTFSTETGIVNVQQNQTLDIRVPLTDAFSSAMTLGRNSTLSMTSPWSIDTGGTLTVTNGATGSFPFATPADVAYISGAAFTLANGTITVATADSTLQFNAPFTLSSGNFVNNGLVVFNANASISSSCNFSMPSNSSSLTLTAGVSVTVNQANFNPDGTGSSTNVITLGSNSLLTLNLGGGADEDFNGTLLLNGGTLAVSTLDNTWSIQSTLTIGASTGTSTLAGEPLTLQSPVNLNVGANSVLNVTANATLAGGTYAGTGIFRLSANTTVSANTTIDTTTFDPDGTTTGSLFTINDGVTLTINSPNFDTDGIMNDAMTIGGSSATLTVNGPASWEMRNTLTTNSANTGAAIIGGTSRLILDTAAALFHVNGNTTINAPITFGTSSLTTIASGAALTVSSDSLYDAATISGAGQFNPGPTNTILTSTLINVAKFFFSAGNWTVSPGATFTVNVNDYDPNFATSKSFDKSITLNSSTLSVTDAALDVFIINGSLNLNNTTGAIPTLTGEDVQVGNDAGGQNANVAVGGTGPSIITPAITFTSDSHLTIATNASLVLTGLATFLPANGASNGSFSGAGTLILENGAIFSELTTLNFTGGTVDLDGRPTDTIGNIIDVQAPVTINAATLASFGKSNSSGTNTITVDHTVAATGSLTVNLDNAASSWTINAPGILNLSNSNVAQTLLAGSPLNLLGTLNVTGDVRTTARLDIGSTGIVNLNSNSVPFHLAGGTLANPNTIAGGTINGLGVLAADTGVSLRGFGTISNTTNIAFAGTAELRASGGTLTVNSALLDVGIAGTADATGILKLTNPQTLDNTMTVELLGGSVTGGALNNNGIIRGNGTVTNIINNNAAGILRGVPAGTLLFTGPVGLTNGTVDLNTGTVEFSQVLLNSSTGIIKGPGTLKADANLTNAGALQLPVGTTNIFGDVTNNSGATVTIAAGGANANFNGNLTLAAGASLTAGASSVNYFLSTLTISGTAALAANVTGTSIHSLVINAGGTFDTSNDKLIIDYTGASPIDTIRSYIQTGRLFSSAANADFQNRLTIGYIEASLLGVSTWSTLPVDTTAVLTKLTYYGDANLDGKVNADDYALLDRGFAKGLTGWSNGDFNHSGSITAADFLLIDRVFAQQGNPLSPSFLAMRESQFGESYVSTLLASVPEPTSLLACGFAIPTLLPRRRRPASTN